jgi:hypothetical protein
LSESFFELVRERSLRDVVLLLIEEVVEAERDIWREGLKP